MKAVKRNSGLFDYLDSLGRLDATGDELRALKAAYRREYMKAYKRSERVRNRHYTLTFKRSETEVIKKASREHGMSENSFIKAAVTGYLKTSYVVKDRIVLDSIFQTLLKFQSTINQVRDRDKGGWFKADKDYDSLVMSLQVIKQRVTEAFATPPLLQDEIKKALANNPNFLQTLKDIVQTYDSQILH